MSAAEDEETQKRGMVGIFYFTNQMETVQRLFTRNVKIFDWIPLRMVGGHFCYPPPDKASLKLLNACLLLIVGRDRRVRVRMHEGKQYIDGGGPSSYNICIAGHLIYLFVYPCSARFPHRMPVQTYVVWRPDSKHVPRNL